MKSTAILRSLVVVVAVIAAVGAVRGAAASAEIARETQRRIRIMVSPQVPSNDIDLNKSKAIEVAVVTEPGWSWSDVDAQTIEFAQALPVKSSYTSKDWDNDGAADRTYFFDPKALKLTPADTIACLKMETITKQKMSGCTTVKVIKAAPQLY